MCAICDHRPATENGICHNCNSKLEAEKRRGKAEELVKFATYQGHVVGFFKNGGSKLVVRLLRRNADSLPKSKTLDLNTYVEGMTRVQVKKIKSAILTLANA